MRRKQWQDLISVSQQESCEELQDKTSFSLSKSCNSPPNTPPTSGNSPSPISDSLEQTSPPLSRKEIYPCSSNSVSNKSSTTDCPFSPGTIIEEISSSQSSVRKSSTRNEEREDSSPSETHSDDRYSLIESYPPRERLKLKPEGEWTGNGSDSGSSSSPPPPPLIQDNESSFTEIRRGSLRRLSSIEHRKLQKCPPFSDSDLLRPPSSKSIVEVINETSIKIE